MTPNRFLAPVAAAAILLGSSIAFAQVVEITPDDEVDVYTHVTREPVRTAPRAGFDVRVGAVIPEDVELYEVPATVRYEPYRRYRYTVYENRAYIVDPSNRRVVRVISRR
jgi:hypothetical protein